MPAQPPVEAEATQAEQLINKLGKFMMVFMAVQALQQVFLQQPAQPRVVPGGGTPLSEGTEEGIAVQEQATAGQEALEGTAPFFPRRDPETGLMLPPHRRIWPLGVKLECHVFLSLYELFTVADSELIWTATDLSYDSNSSNWRAETLEFKQQDGGAASAAWENKTVFAHIFLSLVNGSSNFDPALYNAARVLEAHVPITKHRASKKNVAKHNLLGGKEDEQVETGLVTAADAASPPTILYWKPHLRVRAVLNQEKYPRGGIPPPVAEKLRFDEDGNYYPYIYVDEFWTLQKQLVPVNMTLDSTSLDVSYNSIGELKWQVQSSMEQQWEKQASLGLSSDGDNDMIREVLSDTSPWLLAITAIVSMLHMVFETLAFRNNVKFWRNKKTLEGLSARTIAMNLVFQLVIVLYLFDNETSWMIKSSSVVGVATEAFKLTKAVRLRRDSKGRVVGFHAEESYALSPTKLYDDEATTHLLYVVGPLLAGYAAYSLVTGTHKSWYSWSVTSFVGFIYVFGFVMMTPQLYINYKLKSVAHLPWRAMVYKSLNTFIDDLFAFVIKMPTMHRLSCLRDDIIFLVTLYQRYIYRVDFSRVNEFGQGGDDDDDEPQTALKEAAADDAAAAKKNTPSDLD